MDWQTIIESVGGLSTLIGGGVGVALTGVAVLANLVGIFQKKDNKEVFILFLLIGVLISIAGKWKVGKRWDNVIEPRVIANIPAASSSLKEGLELDNNGFKGLWKVLLRRFGG